MLDQYFRDATEQGLEMERQMPFQVEKGKHSVFSCAYRSARMVLTAIHEVEALK